MATLNTRTTTRTGTALVGMALAMVFSTAAHGAVVIPPAGLSPGDQYRLAFVTRDGIDATSGSISTYNDFVNAQAALNAALPTTSWSAIASTESVDAIDNTSTNGTGVPIYLVGGATPKIADNYLDLWDGSIDNHFDIDQFGDVTLFGGTWTGTTTLGTASPNAFLGTPSGFARHGRTNFLDDAWIEQGIQSTLASDNGLFAISDTTFTVAAAPVPLPAAAWLGLAMLTGLGVCKSQRRRA